MTILSEMSKTEKYDICADISLKRMMLLILKVQEMILEDNNDKKELLSLLSSIEHDILLLNDKENHISRDLYD